MLRKNNAKELAEINKAIKKKNRNEIKEPVLRFKTGCDLLNVLVGGGVGEGYPAGKIVNFVGDKSSGKTFLACEVVAAAYHEYHQKFKWVYDDCESGFSFDTKHLYGVEIMPKKVEDRTRSKTVEQAYCNIRKFAEKLSESELGIYVLDSLDGLSSKEADEIANDRYKEYKKGKEYDKGSYKMGKPKYLSQEFFPQLADLLEKKNILLIIISQVRDNVDPMSFDRYSRAGGKALDFYCHTVLWLAQVHKIKIKDRAVGVTIKAKTTKSKTPRPYREMFMHIYFDYGIHNIATSIDFLYDFLTPTGQLIKGEAKAKWGNQEPNLASIKSFLADHGLEDKYRKTVNPKIKVSEVISWIQRSKNDELKKAYNDEFGDMMTRKSLIDFISKNKLTNELKRKVVEKWELIEQSVKTDLPPKYSGE